MADAVKNVEAKYYKPGQGTWARWVAGVIMALLALFGCHSLYRFPAMFQYDSQGRPLGRTFWGKQLSTSLPGVKDGLTVGLLIAVVVFIAACAGIYFFVINHKKIADFLIDTEAEMHRVSWPPKHEFIGSSIVVFVSIAIIGTFITVMDIAFRMLFLKSGLL